MNWLNQDWEHELQHTEMYKIEAQKSLELELEDFYNNKKLPAKIELIIVKKNTKENEHKTKSI